MSLSKAERKKLKGQRQRKRTESNKTRSFGSSQRRAWVRSLPCSACGTAGYSQNAHIHKIDAGTSHRGSYKGIGPLCGPRYSLSGCHNLFDEHREEFDRKFPWYNPELIAAETERAWLEASSAAEGDDSR